MNVGCSLHRVSCEELRQQLSQYFDRIDDGFFDESLGCVQPDNVIPMYVRILGVDILFTHAHMHAHTHARTSTHTHTFLTGAVHQSLNVQIHKVYLFKTVQRQVD